MPLYHGCTVSALIHTYLRTYRHTRIHTHKYIYIYIHTYIHTYIQKAEVLKMVEDATRRATEHALTIVEARERELALWQYSLKRKEERCVCYMHLFF